MSKSPIVDVSLPTCMPAKVPDGQCTVCGAFGPAGTKCRNPDCARHRGRPSPPPPETVEVRGRVEAMNGTLALVFMPEPHGAFTVEIPGAHAGDEVAVTVRLVKSGAKPGEE